MASSTKRRNPFAVRSTSKPYSPVSGFSEAVENAAAAPRRMAAARDSIAAGARLVSFEGYFRASVLGLPLLLADIYPRDLCLRRCAAPPPPSPPPPPPPLAGARERQKVGWGGQKKPGKSLQNERVRRCLRKRPLCRLLLLNQGRLWLIERSALTPVWMAIIHRDPNCEQCRP